MSDRSVAALILAAGASTRLGQPKQLVELGGEALLRRAVRTATEAGLAPVVVVLGASAAQIVQACDLREAWVVVNSGWSGGMAGSIRCGMELVRTFDRLRGVVVMTCDMPAVSPSHLEALAGTGDEAVASTYIGRHGVPAYFAANLFHTLLSLDGDQGARSLLGGRPAIDLPEGDLDVDTPESLARARQRFGS